MVQGLRIHLAMQGMQVQSLVGELRSHTAYHRAAQLLKPAHHTSVCITTERAHMMQGRSRMHNQDPRQQNKQIIIGVLLSH